MVEGIKPVMTDPAQYDGESGPGTNAVLVQAKGVTIHTRSGESVLSDTSFHIEPGELVALAGLSRAGASALLQSLAGTRPPASGEILIDGVDLYGNLKAFRPLIGYVPARFAVHPQLTVMEVLQDAARLRLPRSTSSQDRKQRLQTLLETAGLTQVTDRRVASLSEAERRRLGIAVELIGYPKLLLLDEPAEALTPFDEVQIIILMRELSRQGITIVLANPRSRSVGLSDKILFLAPGGSLAWFGPADEGFAYLKGFLPRGVVKDLFNLQEALETLVNPQAEDGANWGKRFRSSKAYEKYVDDPLNNRYPDLLLQTRPLLRIRLRNSSKEKVPPPIVRRAGGLQKFSLLRRRNSRVLWRDQTGLLMLAIPPLLALLYFFLSSIAQVDAVGPSLGPGLLVFLVILTAAFLAQNQIVQDRAVYQRESRTSSLLFPYVLSKVWLAGIWAIYQGVVWTILPSLGVIGTLLSGGLQALLPTAIVFTLLAFLGGLLGLVASALSRTATAAGWVIVLSVPLVLFMFDPFSHWSRLALISLFLIVLLMVIQQREASVRS
jgi:ABC-type multidrug transport system ATPase subunit